MARPSRDKITACWMSSTRAARSSSSQLNSWPADVVPYGTHHASSCSASRAPPAESWPPAVSSESGRSSALRPRSHPLCSDASSLCACSGERISGSRDGAAGPGDGLARRCGDRFAWRTRRGKPRCVPVSGPPPGGCGAAGWRTAPPGWLPPAVAWPGKTRWPRKLGSRSGTGSAGPVPGVPVPTADCSPEVASGPAGPESSPTGGRPAKTWRRGAALPLRCDGRSVRPVRASCRPRPLAAGISASAGWAGWPRWPPA